MAKKAETGKANIRWKQPELPITKRSEKPRKKSLGICRTEQRTRRQLHARQMRAGPIRSSSYRSSLLSVFVRFVVVYFSASLEPAKLIRGDWLRGRSFNKFACIRHAARLQVSYLDLLRDFASGGGHASIPRLCSLIDTAAVIAPQKTGGASRQSLKRCHDRDTLGNRDLAAGASHGLWTGQARRRRQGVQR
jgi:hypothetical protein